MADSIESQREKCRLRMCLWINLALHFDDGMIQYEYAAERSREWAMAYLYLDTKVKLYE